MVYSKIILGEIVSINPESIGKEFGFSTIEYIDISSVGTGILEGTSHIERLNAPSRAKRLVREGDTILATVRPNLRSFLFIKNPKANTVVSTGFAVLRPTNKIDPRYLYFNITNGEFSEYLALNAKGAAYPAVDTEIISKGCIYYPSLPIQRKIASILSAYDDLIENNTRRIHILEEMAQTIYREWFVKFRFPGHEMVKMVESAAGVIPEGWEITSIREVSEYINRGVSPKYDEVAESMVINQKCIRNNQLNIGLARRHSTKVPKEKQVRFGDVLINSTGVGTLGRVAQVYLDLSDYTVDSHVTIARSNKKVTFDYFGLFLFGLQDYFDQMGTGSTNQTELGRDTIAKGDFLLPPLQLQEKFSELVFPMRRNIINMQKRNENLRQQRDLLLPRLVSGELDVENLEIETIPELGN